MAKTQNHHKGGACAKPGKNKKFKKARTQDPLLHSASSSIQASFNNTILSPLPRPGRQYALLKSSGSLGFRGSRKGNPLRGAAVRPPVLPTRPATTAARSVDVRVSGPGAGRGVRDPRPRYYRHRSPQHPRRHAHAAQRLPSTQAPQSLRTHYRQKPFGADEIHPDEKRWAYGVGWLVLRIAKTLSAAIKCTSLVRSARD